MVWILTLAVAAGVARHFFFLTLLLLALVVAACLFRRAGDWLLPVLVCACAAVGWSAARDFEDDRSVVARAASSAGAALVTLDGIVVSFPQTGLHGTTFDFATVVDGRDVRMQVRAEWFDAAYGDRYRMRARFVKPSPVSAGFLASRGLAGSLRAKSSGLTRAGHSGNIIARACFWPLHRGTRVQLSRAMGSDSGLAIGMLLGERGQLDGAARESVRKLGISHLLAISGMHLTTVAGCVVLMTRRVPRWRSLALLGALTVYTATVGNVESLTRAYVMAMILLAALASIRPVHAIDALAKALFVMAVAAPLALRSVGLQLSFAATFAVLLLLPHQPRAQRPHRIRALRWLHAGARSVAGAFIVSLAVAVFIAPLQLYHFGSLSWVGPVATVVFFIPVTLVLLGAAPVALMAALAPASEWPGRSLAWLSTRTTDLIVACGHAVPAPLSLPVPDPWLYYGGLCVGWRFRRRRAGWAAGAALVALAFLVGARAKPVI